MDRSRKHKRRQAIRAIKRVNVKGHRNMTFAELQQLTEATQCQTKVVTS